MAEEKQLTEEEKGKKLQEDEQKKSEERVKFVDEIVDQIHQKLKEGLDQHGLQSIVRDLNLRLAGLQVIAAGAEYGPTPVVLEELKKQEFPILTKPMSDGTPVANVAQAPKKGDKPEEPKEFVPKGHATSHPATAKK